MCGFVGYVSKNNVPETDLKDSLNTLAKRGPDAQSFWQSEIDGKTVWLGHQRLAVLDLSQAANQPMVSQDNNFTVVSNQEIYNFLELKKGLDLKSRTTSDTEILLESFARQGEKIISRLDGVFAFAVLDKKNKNLTLARDYFGKKPLYYYLDSQVFAFASELKALIKFPTIKNNLVLDRLSLAKYLFYGYIPSPNTIFSQIKKLEPSTFFQFDVENWQIKNRQRFWNLENIELDDKITEQQALEKLDFLLKEAVKKRLASDVPLGVFLSGGIDSSLVACLATKYSNQVRAFNVTYKNSENDESVYAKKISRLLGLNLDLEYFEEEKVKQSLKEILDYSDEPLSDPAIIPFYHIAKLAKPKITVGLTGDGGDEIFAGYPKYQAQIIAQKLQNFKFLSNLAKILPGKCQTFKKALEGINLPFYIRQFIYGSGGFMPDRVKNLLNTRFFDLDQVFQEASYYHNLFKQKDVLNRALYLDCKLQLPDWYLAKADRAAGAASLEIRSPLLDKNLAEFMFSLKGSFKLNGFKTKYLFKQLAKKYLPADIINRKKKGFQVPLKKWLKNDFSRLTELRNLLDSGILNKNAILQVKAGLARDIPGAETQIWRLIILDNFIKKYL